jgi:hypothetical protein
MGFVEKDQSLFQIRGIHEVINANILIKSDHLYDKLIGQNRLYIKISVIRF